jgi:hypothetical protein
MAFPEGQVTPDVGFPEMRGFTEPLGEEARQKSTALSLIYEMLLNDYNCGSSGFCVLTISSPL